MREMSVTEQGHKAVLAIIGDGRTVGEWPGIGASLGENVRSATTRQEVWERKARCPSSYLNVLMTSRPEWLKSLEHPKSATANSSISESRSRSLWAGKLPAHPVPNATARVSRASQVIGGEGWRS